MEQATQTVRMTTPIGELQLVAQGEALVAMHMGPHSLTAQGEVLAAVHMRDDADLAVLTTAQEQLESYLAGKSDSFALPTRARGTRFQQEVWRALREVGYGETTTYGELAARIGRPRAARAVGQALARNPLPIVVPCHRVVGHGGDLTGFGGGIDRKRFLLDLESRARSGRERP